MISKLILFLLTAFIFFQPALNAQNTYTKENSGGDQSENTWTISGYIYLDGNQNNLFSGVTVVFSGVGSTTTNEMGYYAHDVPNNWSGTVTPSYCSPHYIFSPFQHTYTMVRKHFTQQNFQGAVSETFTISGTITHASTSDPMSDFLITFSNGMETTTDENGFYEITVNPCFSDTLMPVSDDYNFTPGYRVYDGVTSNYESQDYSIIDTSFGLPPGWEYTNTGTVHIISVFTSANPSICGIPLQQGDYIGVFYVGDDGELHCGGAGEWTGEENVGIFANGNDSYTSVKDGFAFGEPMQWKIFSWSTTQQEYVAYPNYQSGEGLVSNNKWYSGGLSIVNGLNAYEKQEIVIPAGWSGISGFLTPRTNNLANTMKPIVDEIVVMQTLTKLYYPSQGINNILLWNTNHGYKIKVTEDVILPFPGCELTDRSLNMTATWNIIPVKSECYVQVSELFNPVVNNVIVVKEIAGNNVYWPQMGINTLQVLSPGKAYLVAVNQNTSITFPECTNLKSAITGENAMIKNTTSWADPVATPSSHTIAVAKETLAQFATGDFIGAFTQEGIIAGLAQITTLDDNTSITVFGDDQTVDEKVGFDEEEILSFKVFKTATGEVVNLWVEFDHDLPDHQGVFIDNGLSLITDVHMSPSGNNEIDPHNDIWFYPNPSSGIIDVAANELSYSVVIRNLLGSSVFTQDLTESKQIDLSHLHAGIYIIEIEGKGFLKVDKLMLR
jgi:hypothetical protein